MANRTLHVNITDMAIAEVRSLPSRPIRHQDQRRLEGLISLNKLIARCEAEVEDSALPRLRKLKRAA